MKSIPGEIELVGNFNRHLGPRCEGAGLRIQFHYNQTPGIHFKTQVQDAYRTAIMKGLEDGLKLRFPDLPDNTSVWVVEVMEHPVDSSERAFYKAARMIIDQAFSLVNNKEA